MKNLELEGMCPKCGEWTEAQESCCGFGAIVEGSLMGEDEAQERLEEICRDCAGNGTTNPPAWTVKCHRCGGSGLLKNGERNV